MPRNASAMINEGLSSGAEGFPLLQQKDVCLLGRLLTFVFRIRVCVPVKKKKGESKRASGWKSRLW